MNNDENDEIIDLIYVSDYMVIKMKPVKQRECKEIIKQMDSHIEELTGLENLKKLNRKQVTDHLNNKILKLDIVKPGQVFEYLKK
jgi:hypothetical protein